MDGTAPWSDARLRAAWARRDWPTVFRLYRQLTGISQTRLGQLIDMAQSRVSTIEHGRRLPTSEAVIDRITRGLNVPDELGGARQGQPSEWAPPAELRERIARAHTTGRADIRTADWIRRVLAEHRRAEDVVGGRDLWPVVRSQLDTVTALLPGTSGDTADRLLVLAAEHAHWLSWVAAQERRMGAALAWLDLARGWATDAAAYDMVSWVDRVRAYYMLSGGDPVRALRTAEAARWAPEQLHPSAAAAATHTAAMAAATIGERDWARRLSEEAYALAVQAPAEEERPGWLYWLTPVRAQLQRADTAYAVRDWADAAAGFRQALDGLGDGYPRDRAYYEQRLADACARA